MKPIFAFLTACIGLAASASVFALSFIQGTQFLDIDNHVDCEAAGGSFIEWYGETYCTIAPDTSPAVTLSNTEEIKLGIAVRQMTDILDKHGGADSTLYALLIDLLEEYRATFITNQSMKKVAIIDYLLDALQDYNNDEGAIPNNCSVWFDGCNTCQVMENGELACTKMACFVQEDPMCKVYEKVVMVADHTETCVGLAQQECLLVHQVEGVYRMGDPIPGIDITNAMLEDKAVYFYQDIEGFEYIPGYTWTLLIEEHHLDANDVPMDASTIQWKLKKVLATQKEMPDDGISCICNESMAGEGCEQVRPDVCTAEYDPVCGCDGLTYGNACNALAAGLSSWTMGECIAQE